MRLKQTCLLLFSLYVVYIEAPITAQSTKGPALLITTGTMTNSTAFTASLLTQIKVPSIASVVHPSTTTTTPRRISRPPRKAVQPLVITRGKVRSPSVGNKVLRRDAEMTPSDVTTSLTSTITTSTVTTTSSTSTTTTSTGTTTSPKSTTATSAEATTSSWFPTTSSTVRKVSPVVDSAGTYNELLWSNQEDDDSSPPSNTVKWIVFIFVLVIVLLALIYTYMFDKFLKEKAIKKRRRIIKERQTRRTTRNSAEDRKGKQKPIVFFNTQAKEVEGESASEFFSGLRIREVVYRP